MRVFLSSTCHGFEARRKLLAGCIEEAGFDAVLSEAASFPGLEQASDPCDLCLDRVRASDVLVVVVQAGLYSTYSGTRDAYKGLSMVQAELRAARLSDKHVIALVEEGIMSSVMPEASTAADSAAVELYAELSDTAPSWTHAFSDDLDAVSQLRTRLNLIRNTYRHDGSRGWSDAKILRDYGLSYGKSPVDIASRWTMVCDAWTDVRKEWRVSIQNNTGADVSVQDPLHLSIRHNPVRLGEKSLSVRRRSIGATEHVECVLFEIQPDKGGGNRLVVQPSERILLGAGDRIDLRCTLHHSGYFQETDDGAWSHRGAVVYLAHPSLPERALQRTRKEYHIAKHLTDVAGLTLGIYRGPECDWIRETASHWVLGYGRHLTDASAVEMISIMVR